MSFFPSSTKVPPSAVKRHEASSKLPVRTFRMTSIPFPLVASSILEAKASSREEKVRSPGIPKDLLRNSRFSSVPTVA